jgi:hypothetical protein
LPPEGKSGRAVAVLLAPAAVLVAVVLLLLRMRIEPPTIPPYKITPTPSAEPVLRPGDRLEMTLEPVGQLTGAIGGRGFLLQGQQVRNWEPELVVDRDGTIHVTGDIGKLFAGVPAGEWDLAIAVGRPETLPRTPADVLRARDADAGPREAAWYLVRERVRLGD